jgi:hypothetical protein
MTPDKVVLIGSASYAVAAVHPRFDHDTRIARQLNEMLAANQQYPSRFLH